MAGRPKIVPRENCVVNTRKNELMDLEPLRDIRDTPEDRELYPNDWVEIILLSRKVYDVLLKRTRTTIQRAVPWLHPNKSLWVTLRHMVIGDTIRSSEEGALERTCASISRVFEDGLMPRPPNFNAIAADFEAIWKVPNCLGAIAAELLTSDHLYQYICNEWGQEVIGESHWALAVDAKMQVIYSKISTGIKGETFQQVMDLCNLGQLEGEGTFVGDQQFGARKWLRVPTRGKTEANKEIQRAMTPAKVTLNVLLSRFGILKLKHPLMSHSVLSCIPVLHNYFMRTNPAYGAFKRIMEEFEKDPEAVPVPIKDTVFGGIKEAMQRMKMDENCVRVLQDKCGVQAGNLHDFLSFICLGKIDKEKLGLYLACTLDPFFNGLSEYRQMLPFPPRKWLQISNEFESKMQIPNCGGVIATRRVAIYTESGTQGYYGVLVLIIDSNYRVSYAVMCVPDTVSFVLNQQQLNLPKNKELVFIGSEGLEKNPRLVRPGDTGHLTEAQVNRGLSISEKLIDVLEDRFAVLDNSVAKQSEYGMSCVTFVCAYLHNFLMDQSPIYAARFFKSS